MAQDVKIAGALFSNVPSISVPDNSDVYHSFYDVSDTTATAEDVAQGKYFYTAAGVKTEGTGGGATLQAKTNIAPTTSSQTITPDAGYDGLSSVQINAMPSGSVTAPSTISGTGSSITTGTNLLTFSKTISVTPTVSTAGYVSSGTAGNSNVSLSASVVTKAAATITPGTTDQTIGSGTYLTGTQTIKGDENLIADNIKKDAVIFNITGTYEGGSVWQSGIYQDEDGFICVSPNAGASANGITLLTGDIVMSTV